MAQRVAVGGTRKYRDAGNSVNSFGILFKSLSGSALEADFALF